MTVHIPQHFFLGAILPLDTRDEPNYIVVNLITYGQIWREQTLDFEFQYLYPPGLVNIWFSQNVPGPKRGIRQKEPIALLHVSTRLQLKRSLSIADEVYILMLLLAIMLQL